MQQLVKQINNLCSVYLEPRPLTLVTYIVLSKGSVSVIRPLVLEAISSAVEKETLQLLARREYVRMLSEPGVPDELNVSLCIQIQYAMYNHVVRTWSSVRMYYRRSVVSKCFCMMKFSC